MLGDAESALIIHINAFIYIYEIKQKQCRVVKHVVFKAPSSSQTQPIAKYSARSARKRPLAALGFDRGTLRTAGK